MDPFRCIQADRLLLDHQLRGVPATFAGGLTPDVRKILQDATLLAFEHMIDQALAHDVHCLLISGDSFDPDDRGLRGPAALVRGIQRLAEHDIPVMLYANRPDLWSSWPAGLRLPANAHRLGAGLATSASVAREGKLLATITADESAPGPAGRSSAVRSDWSIHLPAMAHPADASTAVNTIRLHGDRLNADRRPAQGMHADECGPHGCTLIELDARGEPLHTFIPAAPVCWERFCIEVSTEAGRDDLLQEMASRLEQTRRQTCEKVWLIAWDVTGTGPLFERLGNGDFRDEMLAELTALDPVPGVQIHTHAWRWHLATDCLRSSGDGGTIREPPLPEQNEFEQKALEEDLAAEFAMRLDERFADPRQAIGACLAGSPQAGGPWLLKIESLVADLDAREVAQNARELAVRWFAEAGHAEQGEPSS